MVWNYARAKTLEQARAVAFIILYLAVFQVLVLGAAPSQALRVAGGLAMVVFGLTFFMEGLLLGLMPLGERVGVQLPRYSGLGGILVFGLLLGLGSTLAEPAVAALRVAGGSVTAWETPLLFLLLTLRSEALVISIGAGVGVAVALGMWRFYRGLSIKPFIYTAIPLLLLLSVLFTFDDKLAAIIGLAWDTGAVTTGAVTVPLVLALGVGVSRASRGRTGSSTGGFGLIMLASAYPVLGVLLLGLLLHPRTPGPVDETTFFSTARRPEAMRLFASEADLARHAFRRGSAEAREALYGDPAAHEQAVRSLTDPGSRRQLLGDMGIGAWLTQRASAEEAALLNRPLNQPAEPDSGTTVPTAGILARSARGALRAVLPLALLLAVVLLLLLKSRPRYGDEVLLGVGMALVGMTLLTSGIQLGLAPMGDDVGRLLPRLFRSTDLEQERILIDPFNPADVMTGYDTGGEPERFFFFRDRQGRLKTVPYHTEQHQAAAETYEHIVSQPPLFGPRMTLAGIALVFLFAFGLGYGSTLAEPALGALGRTVERVSVGTIRSAGVVRAVSLGVGLGLVAGVARILYDLPITWLLMPPYLLLLPLTHWSEEEFTGIAWDCGGVTTGIVTVPLVLAMGLGIGGEMGVVEGFGVLAMASVYPILTVLIHGLFVRARRRRAALVAAGEEHHAG